METWVLLPSPPPSPAAESTWDLWRVTYHPKVSASLPTKWDSIHMRIETWESDGYMRTTACQSSLLPRKWVNKKKNTLGCEILRLQIGGRKVKLSICPWFGCHVKIRASSGKRSFSCKQAFSESLCDWTATDFPLPIWRHFSALLVRIQLFIRQRLIIIMYCSQYFTPLFV